MKINNLFISALQGEEMAKANEGSRKYRENRSDAFKALAQEFSERTTKMVYVCSPYRAETDEEVQANVDFAIASCEYVLEEEPGTMPMAPHIYFTQFLNDKVAEDRIKGLNAGIALLGLCDELWVFGERISEGMAAEIAYAKKIGIPVRYIDLVEEGGEDNA